MVRYQREDEAIAEAFRSTRRGLRDVQRPTGTERAQTTLVAQQTAGAVEVIEVITDPREPKAPSGLTVTSSASWTQTAPSAILSASWSAVTLGDDDQPIDVVAYALWGRLASEPSPRLLTETEALTALHGPVTPASQWLLSVRAQSATRVWGPLSVEVAVTAATPDVSMPVPKAPVLTTTPGLIVVTPDGPVSGSWPSHLMRLDVEVASAAVGPWAVTGSLTKGAGKVQFAAPSTSARWVRLVPVDLLNRAGTAGAAATITTAGVDVGDLDADVTAIIDQALEDAASAQWTADGRNRIYSAVSMPGGVVDAVNLVTNPEGAGTGSVEVWRNLAAGLTPGVLGTATIDTGIVWGGDSWSRLTAGVAFNGCRLDMSGRAAYIPDGVALFAQWEIANPSASPVSVRFDVGDMGSTDATLAPGERRIVSTSATRAAWTGWRFADMAIHTTASPVLFRRILSAVGGLPPYYFDAGSSPDSDLVPGLLAGAGTPAILSGVPITGASNGTSRAIRSSKWALNGSDSMRVVSLGNAAGASFAELPAWTGASLRGKTITIVTTSRALGAVAGTSPRRAALRLYGYATPFLYGPTSSNVAGVEELRWTVTIPNDVSITSVALRLFTTESSSVGISQPDVFWDVHTVVEVPSLAEPYTGPPFSGATPPTPGRGYRWTGTPDASTSEAIVSDYTPGDLLYLRDPVDTSTPKRIIGTKIWNGVEWESHGFIGDYVIVPGTVGNVSIMNGAITAVELTVSQEMWVKIMSTRLLTAEYADIPSLTTAIISAGASGILDIVASQTITLIAGELAPVQEALIEQIVGVADAQAGTAAALAAQQLAFSITTDFVRIGRPNSNFDITIDDMRLAFRENQVVRTWLEAGQWHAESIVTPQLIIGAFVIEETPGGLAFRRT